jgi:hypothetical protein
MALVPLPLRRLRERSARSLFCPKCHHRIFFEQIRCDRCWQPLAFDPITLRIRQLEEVTACSNRILISCNWAAAERNQILLFVRSDPYNPKPWLVEEPAVVESG